MISQCPGQDSRNLKIEILQCQNCGYNLEIFSDEIKIKCPKCKTLVCRVRLHLALIGVKYPVNVLVRKSGGS